jgi:hypothetical protein
VLKYCGAVTITVGTKPKRTNGTASAFGSIKDTVPSANAPSALGNIKDTSLGRDNPVARIDNITQT